MTFSGLQLSALLKMGKAMIAADGKVKEEEKIGLSIEVAKFGIPADQLKNLLTNADSMSAEESIII
ncbi:MAG: tellurite resistance protein TerB, partial [Muribaculaceae bacterium]|nr:tellurite resistance protein TerB [Muribaculaceae bacterium]